MLTESKGVGPANGGKEGTFGTLDLGGASSQIAFYVKNQGKQQLTVIYTSKPVYRSTNVFGGSDFTKVWLMAESINLSLSFVYSSTAMQISVKTYSSCKLEVRNIGTSTQKVFSLSGMYQPVRGIC